MVRMSLFRVLVEAEGFWLRSDEGPDTLHRLFRNVFVRASTEEMAKTIAVRHVLSDISQRPQLSALASLTEADFRVDEAEPSWRYWKLLRQEGFIFYPLDAS
jgi:hypothetical protein